MTVQAGSAGYTLNDTGGTFGWVEGAGWTSVLFAVGSVLGAVPTSGTNRVKVSGRVHQTVIA